MSDGVLDQAEAYFSSTSQQKPTNTTRCFCITEFSQVSLVSAAVVVSFGLWSLILSVIL
ncbi:MAG: hypothetical protein VW297_01430 [Paracoccaceae bacterium]